MRGKTHIAAGAAAAVALLDPTGAAEVVALGLVGAAGGLLPDADLLKSNGSKDASACAGLVALGIAGAMFVDRVVPFGLSVLITGSMGPQPYLGIAGILATTAFGVSRPHREFTHSLLFCACSMVAVCAVCPLLAAPLGAGLISHLVLDLLNKRGLCLFWPAKRRICLGLCASGGVIDAVVGMASLRILCCVVLLRLMG